MQGWGKRLLSGLPQAEERSGTERVPPRGEAAGFAPTDVGGGGAVREWPWGSGLGSMLGKGGCRCGGARAPPTGVGGGRGGSWPGPGGPTAGGGVASSWRGKEGTNGKETMCRGNADRSKFTPAPRTRFGEGEGEGIGEVGRGAAHTCSRVPGARGGGKGAQRAQGAAQPGERVSTVQRCWGRGSTSARLQGGPEEAPPWESA